MDLKEYQTKGEQIHNMGIFVGCNINKFSSTSIVPIDIAKQHGLTLDTKVLEIGTGCCRVGYHFIEHLSASHYCGIEPNVKMLEAGKDILLGDLLHKKSPRFNNGEDFNLSVFDENFDMIIAFSIWSHSPKWAIEKTINQFSSFKPCVFLGTIIFSNNERDDYLGNDWVGYSHESLTTETPTQLVNEINKVRGTVKHSLDWLDSVCKSNNCKLEVLRETTVNQQWIKIETI